MGLRSPFLHVAMIEVKLRSITVCLVSFKKKPMGFPVSPKSFLHGKRGIYDPPFRPTSGFLPAPSVKANIQCTSHLQATVGVLKESKKKERNSSKNKKAVLCTGLIKLRAKISSRMRYHLFQNQSIAAFNCKHGTHLLEW